MRWANRSAEPPRACDTTTVDRLPHHAHVIITDGSDSRLAHAVAGKGVRQGSSG
jgi:hypothetical protein